jgi:hypothetical protein
MSVADASIKPLNLFACDQPVALICRDLELLGGLLDRLIAACSSGAS